MSCPEACLAWVRDELARMGVEAHVTTTPPVAPGAYEDLAMRCPHGVRVYAEPTGEQVVRWAAGGVS